MTSKNGDGHTNPLAAPRSVTDEPPHSRFIFYCTAPFLAAFLVLTPLLARPPKPTGWVIFVTCEIVALLVLLGLFNAQRFWWCWRGVGEIIFIGYLAYLVAMLSAGELLGDGRRSSSNALNAAIGLLAFGLPGLRFAIFGRLTVRSEPELDDYTDEWPNDDEAETEPAS